MNLKSIIEEFEDCSVKESGLVVFKIKPKFETKHKILLVGGEHGDKPYATKAILGVCKKLKNELKNLEITAIPVLDVKGYPTKRSIIGDEGFGKPIYMDRAYFFKNPPKEIIDFFSVINQNSYDLAALLSSVNKEELLIVNGFYAIFPFNKEVKEYSTIAKDVAGSVVQKLKEEKIKLLRRKEPNLGGGYILLSEGMVVENYTEMNTEKLKEKNQFIASCILRKIPAVAFYALSSEEENSEENKKAIFSLEKAIETIVKIYENL